MLIFVFNLKNMWDQSWDFIIGEKSPIFKTLLVFMTCWPTNADVACSGTKSGTQNGTLHRRCSYTQGHIPILSKQLEHEVMSHTCNGLKITKTIKNLSKE